MDTQTGPKKTAKIRGLELHALVAKKGWDSLGRLVLRLETKWRRNKGNTEAK